MTADKHRIPGDSDKHLSDWRFDKAEGREVNAENVNNEVYAKQFDGAGLASKVENALDWLKNNVNGKGRVRVTPKNDGTDWSWDKDLVIDPYEYHGVHLDIDNNVKIDYPGSGWALTLDRAGDFNRSEETDRITGGEWWATGDPSGWLKLKDIGNAIIEPATVDFANNVSGSAGNGISIENHDRWSEMNLIRDAIINADTCIDSKPANVTGGTGSSSFQGTSIRDVNLHGETQCIHIRGNWNYSNIGNPNMFLESDGARGINFDNTQNRGLTITAGKTEEHASNTTSFYFGPNFDGFHPPTLVGGHYKHPTNMTQQDSGVGWADNTHLYHVRGQEGALRFRILGDDFVDSINIHDDLPGETLYMQVPASVVYTPVDVTSLSSSANQGSIAYHDPSINSDGNTEGPAFYNGSAWTSLVDGSTIS